MYWYRMEQFRLPIVRRGEISLILRRHVLARRGDGAGLAALDDPALAPHPRLAGYYAFESFLSDCRSRLSEHLEETAVYNEAWVRLRLERDDRFLRTDGSISRLASALFFEDAESGGDIQRCGEVWFEEEVGWDSPVDRDECVAFVGEIVLEIFVELVLARIRERDRET